jgi:hypothetical protein
MLINVPTRALAPENLPDSGKEQNSRSLPRIVDPHIPHRPCGTIPSLQNLLRQLPLLPLVLVMQHKNAKLGRLPLPPQLLHRSLDILLQLAHRILERRPRVVHLVDNQHVLADQICHFERGQVEPLRARDFCARRFDFGIRAERLVQREADGLDGDVGRPGLFEEGAEDARGDVAAAADGDHEVGLEVGEDLGGGFLAEFVHLVEGEWVGAVIGYRMGCARVRVVVLLLLASLMIPAEYRAHKHALCATYRLPSSHVHIPGYR